MNSISNSVSISSGDMHVTTDRREMTKASLGSKLCTTVENVVTTAVALKKIAEFGAQKGTRTLCSTAALVTGLGQIWEGNILMGSSLTIAGAFELYKTLGSNYDKSEVSRLIGDAKAGVQMIQTLEEANKESFSKVDANLDLVSQNVAKLTQQLTDIKQLSANGSIELEGQKATACKLYEEANELFAQAQQALQGSREEIGEADELFTRALNQFGSLLQSAQSNEGKFEERVKQFTSDAEKVHKQCLEAKTHLETSGASFDKALLILQAAIDKNNAASIEAGKAMQLAADNLKMIQAKAEIENDCQEEIQVIRDELNDVKQRKKVQDALLTDIYNDLNEAEQINQANWGTFSVCVGAPLGFITGNAIGGIAGGAVGVPVAVQLVHDRNKIGNFLFGADKEPVPEKASDRSPVTFKYNEHSTGFWGRYIQKRQSYTAGKVSICLGDEEISYKFNLNDKNRICKKDLLDISKRLADKLNRGIITPAYCQKVISNLETMKMDRNTKKAAIGLVTKNNPYFGHVQMMCATLIKNQ
ncbi:hypothetical protein PNK_0814 [Candidatus Protochlamydia naegleriophila]|uniref:Uncharacterized protein n=1 Tax=Candidatus Protochlamydia naegleriophila TaxID=389348 RepID=A0A0U5JBD4_9BACT|nr:hypothetical protein [Candidatus Protochlamydia naegleriophila]CUI16439.1 hypothetical protein PNK_0814 [Candidatus Protochlamydia naegleriophila]